MAATTTSHQCSYVNSDGVQCLSDWMHVTNHRFPAAAKCAIQGQHCENCGSTDYEDLHTGDQGYTACCNELIAYDAAECRGHHIH